MWSVGAILFEALAGRPPHEDCGAFHANLVAILQDDPPKLGTVAPWVPSKIARVVDDLLVRDPERRIPDCAQLTARLLAAAPHVSPDFAERKTAIIVTPSARDLSSSSATASGELAAIPDALPSDPTLVAPSAHIVPLVPLVPNGASSSLPPVVRTLSVPAMQAAQASSILSAPQSPSSSAAHVVPAPTPHGVKAVTPPAIASASECAAHVARNVRRPWPLVGFAFGVAAVAAFVTALTFTHMKNSRVAAAASTPRAQTTTTAVVAPVETATNPSSVVSAVPPPTSEPAPVVTPSASAKPVMKPIVKRPAAPVASASGAPVIEDKGPELPESPY
jgi:serine/threonine-protein kinase